MNEQTMNQEEIQQPIKKPFYKKWWAWAIAAVIVVIAIALFSGNPVQDDLLDYVNNDTTEMVELEEELIDLYEKARNSANDYIFYEKLMDEVIPKSKELIDEVESIDIETDEVKKVHEIYIDATNKQDQAFTLMLSALENQDYTVLTQANEKLEESRKLKRDYKSAINELAKEYDVEISYE